MDFNIEIRKKQLDNLDQLISSSRERIESVLKYLGWNAEIVDKEDSLVPCPINPHHRVCPKSWNEHISKCVIKLEGYDVKEQFLSESVDDPTQSIYLDRNKKIEIVTKELAERGSLRLAWNGLDPDPRTADRMVSTFSPDERLIFYNYAIKNTVGPPPPPEFTTLYNKKPDEEKPLTYEELLAQERDAKRRRAKYRSVHINRKNHTEVIREVINGQMEEYKEWLLAKEQTKECSKNGVTEERREEQERPHSSTSRNSNRSSSSRSTSRKKDRYRDRRETSAEHNRLKGYRDERHKGSPPRNSYEGGKYRRKSVERRHSSRDRSRRDDVRRR